MPLLLLDLDNTLVDRAAAFHAWGTELVDGLDGTSAAQLVDDLRRGMVERLTLDHAVPRALTAARDAGWVPVIVTNGSTIQQERKIRHTGLDRWAAAWVVSESAGPAKPDPQLFQLAADAAGRHRERLAASRAHLGRAGVPAVGDRRQLRRGDPSSRHGVTARRRMSRRRRATARRWAPELMTSRR